MPGVRRIVDVDLRCIIDHDVTIDRSGADDPASAGGDGRFHLGYRPELDGIRAFSVIAVMGVHAGLDRLKGGFLGVQSFFVLSGFLITIILLDEWRREGRISLKRFYIRRALRLLPAMALVVAACGAYVLVFPDRPESQSFLRDAAATIGYVANWLWAAEGLRAHLLVHTWSLAIEEQFYFLWPLTIIALLRWRPKAPVLLSVVIAGALASAVLRAGMFANGVGTDRLYFGLDTRADALLIGCALGIWISFYALPSATWFRAATFVAALLAGVTLAVSATAFQLGAPFLYRIGFTVVAAATAAVILHVVVSPAGFIGRLLALRPLVYLGRISYGLYLWHWPVFGLVDVFDAKLSGPVEVLVKSAAAIAVAALSYRYFETPFLRMKDRYGKPSAVPVSVVG